MLCGIEKNHKNPYKSFTLDIKKKFFKTQLFFKTSSSSNEALSKALKSSSSILEIYKEQSFVGSNINIL